MGIGSGGDGEFKVAVRSVLRGECEGLLQRVGAVLHNDRRPFSRPRFSSGDDGCVQGGKGFSPGPRVFVASLRGDMEFERGGDHLGDDQPEDGEA
jgi:hypothetical protein